MRAHGSGVIMSLRTIFSARQGTAATASRGDRNGLQPPWSHGAPNTA